jgi:hypothetical protein
MKIFLYLHYLITLTFLILPFLPLKLIINYKLFLFPILLSLYWLMFNGCHISKMHINKNGYIEDLLYKLFNIKITKLQTRHLITFTTCLVPTMIIIRILLYKKYFCKNI